MTEKSYKCDGCGVEWGFQCHADACYFSGCPTDENGDPAPSQFRDVKIVVLNDGETYSDIRGASVMTVDWAAWENTDELEQAVKEVAREDRGASVRLSTGGEVVKTDWLDERLFYDVD